MSIAGVIAVTNTENATMQEYKGKCQQYYIMLVDYCVAKSGIHIMKTSYMKILLSCN